MRLTKKLSAVTSVLALGTVSLTPAHAATEAEPVTIDPPVASVIASSATAQLSFERPAVTTSPAPYRAPATAPVTVQVPASQVPVQTQAEPTVTKTATILAAPAASSVPAPAPVPAPVTRKGQGIASAALAQLGIAQDCTALVSNSLSAVGIYFHGWPADYLSLGRVVSGAEAQPGDLIYYASAGAGVPHIAVYIGNGMAVHGGFNGSTVVFSAYQGSGPVFIRV